MPPFEYTGMPGSWDARTLRVLGLAALAVFLTGFDGSVLFLALPAISAEFRAAVPALADLGSVLEVGVLGALPLAALADRRGRRGVLALAVALAAAANLASGLAPSLAALTVCRTVAVCAEAASASVATAFVVEELPPGWRGRGVALLTVAGGAGTAVTVLSYPLLTPHWRLLYLAGAAGLPAAAALWRFLPESRAWSRAAASPGSGVIRLLSARRWRPRLLVLSAATGLGAALYAPAGLFVALYGSRLGLTPQSISAVVVISGLASLPAFFIGARISDALGRRLPAVATTGSTALAAGTAFTGSLGAYWAGNVVWSVLASASVPILGAWTGEMFPTRGRASAETVAAVAAGVGGVCGLQLVALLSGSRGLGTTLAVLALPALVGAGLLLRLPETHREPLPD